MVQLYIDTGKVVKYYIQDTGYLWISFDRYLGIYYIQQKGSAIAWVKLLAEEVVVWQVPLDLPYQEA